MLSDVKSEREYGDCELELIARLIRSSRDVPTDTCESSVVPSAPLLYQTFGGGRVKGSRYYWWTIDYGLQTTEVP